MTIERTAEAHREERRDLAGWLLLVAVGSALTWAAVRAGARLGTAGAPFLGQYALAVGPPTLLAAAVAAALLTATAYHWLERLPWPAVLGSAWTVTFVWTVGLIGGRSMSPDRGGHDPTPVLAEWAVARIDRLDPVAATVLLAATGALAVPLVLSAVRGVCGDLPARRYVPVLALAPYAVWLALGVEAVVTALGAAMVAAGVWASDARRTGVRAGLGATACGLLLGTASLFSYGLPWLGLSVACLYFARRRAALNFFTGAAALVPIVVAQVRGFGWADGLMAARHDFAVRIEPHRSVLWWTGISLVVLLLAVGPALYASLRKAGNTPGWPFLVGAGCAVVFTVLAGLARGGSEVAWLAYFPWLTVAATAPRAAGGPPVPAPLLLAGAGAVTALAVAAVLSPAL